MICQREIPIVIETSEPCDIVHLTNTFLPDAPNGFPYDFTLTPVGTYPPFTFTDFFGLFAAAGFNLDAAGNITGTPGTTGVFPVAPMVEDDEGHQCVTPLTLEVVEEFVWDATIYTINEPVGTTVYVFGLMSGNNGNAEGRAEDGALARGAIHFRGHVNLSAPRTIQLDIPYIIHGNHNHYWAIEAIVDLDAIPVNIILTGVPDNTPGPVNYSGTASGSTALAAGAHLIDIYLTIANGDVGGPGGISTMDCSGITITLT